MSWSDVDSVGRGNVVTSKRFGLVTRDHADPSIYWGRGKVEHLRIVITCVARAMCGVTETDCSCIASIRIQNIASSNSIR